MASQPPAAPPESVIFGSFKGLKNTVSRERLGPDELERAINVHIDDAGQISRRRGYVRKIVGEFHSLIGIDNKAYGVMNGQLGIVRPDYTFFPLGVTIGPAPVCYTEVAGAVFFSSSIAQGIIQEDETVVPWGQTDGQGAWVSPVYTPTDTLGEVGGRLVGDPPPATALAAYKGRIYLAAGKVLWATELFGFHFVDRTKNFMQFEDDITMVSAASDGLWVGTTGGTYFMAGTLEAFRPLEQFRLTKVSDDNVLPGSLVYAPVELIHPQAQSGPVPSGTACMFMTSGGIVAAFDGGSCFNITRGTFIFPNGVSAASLFRQDSGANHYVAAIDSDGGPSANCRIGDYCEAEIVRRI